MAIGIILLAAGASKRMGQNKLLLQWKGKTVLERACDTITALEGPKVIVLGKDFERMKEYVKPYDFTVLCNEQTELGQSFSLKKALKILPLDELSGVLCMVADQPMLTTKLLQEMISSFDENNHQDIICPRYGDKKGVGTLGNPVLFGSFWFDALQSLTGDQGGKQILRGVGQGYIKVVFAPAIQGMDIDTLESYMDLFAQYGNNDQDQI